LGLYRTGNLTWSLEGGWRRGLLGSWRGDIFLKKFSKIFTEFGKRGIQKHRRYKVWPKKKRLKTVGEYLKSF